MSLQVKCCLNKYYSSIFVRIFPLDSDLITNKLLFYFSQISGTGHGYIKGGYIREGEILLIS